jgi:hypothetical protein
MGSELGFAVLCLRMRVSLDFAPMEGCGGISTGRYGRSFSLTRLHMRSGAFVDATLEGLSTKSLFDDKHDL